MDERVEATLRSDPVMAGLVEEYGPLPLEVVDNEFERLCVSIVNQQLSTASAAAVRERVFELLDGVVTPAAVLAADEAALREAGLSTSKVEYVRNAAEAFDAGDLTREALADRSEAEVVEELTRIRGVGEWTARMYLIFALGREDVFPVGDLAVRRAVESLYGEMTRDEMVAHAERWAPYRSYATRYLWTHYEG